MKKRWLAIVAVIAGGVLAARKLMSRPDKPMTRPADHQKGFSIATYNLQAAEDSIEPIIKVIRELNADIVALQEVTKPLSEKIDSDLRELYPHRSLHPAPNDGQYSGQGVLSRFPIKSEEFWEQSMGHLYVQLDVEGRTLHVMNTHPAAPSEDSFEQRSEEIEHVLRYVQDNTGPMVLLGDMNMTEWSDDYSEITKEFTDAFANAEVGNRATFPQNMEDMPFVPDFIGLPMVRLDYIFHNKALCCMNAEAWPESGGSDHHPVWAVLQYED